MKIFPYLQKHFKGCLESILDGVDDQESLEKKKKMCRQKENNFVRWVGLVERSQGDAELTMTKRSLGGGRHYSHYKKMLSDHISFPVAFFKSRC